jgi:putative transposase
MKFRKQAHSVYYSRYHLVFATRFRRKVLKARMGRYLCILMQAINRRHPEIEIIEVNTDEDHVHLLVSIALKMAVSEAVRILKANNARPMYKRFPFLEKVYYDGDRGIWSDGYFMSTAGINEDIIRNYILHQEQEDSGQVQLDL